jgi:hypothetical protein
MSSNPTDKELDQIPMAKGEVDATIMAAQAKKLAEKFATPRGPKLRGRRQRPKTQQRPKGVTQPEPSTANEQTRGLLQVGNLSYPPVVEAPPGAEVATTGELSEIESIATALSDTVSDLTTELYTAMDRIEVLEESNTALQTALTRVTREVSSLAALVKGSTGLVSVLPGPVPPQADEKRLVPELHPGKMTMPAPSDTLNPSDKERAPQATEWGVSGDIE